MSNETRTGTRCASGDRVEPLGELCLPLEELIRRGTRDILQRTIEAEVGHLLEEFARVLLLLDGRGAVVRNGHLPTLLSRLEAQWSEADRDLASGSLADSRCADWWIDGIQTTLRKPTES